jgi:membrane-associated PAP2 superfamily phosphatase
MNAASTTLPQGPSLRPVVEATVAALLALLAWDFSGADIALTRWFGNAQGFAWRDHFLTAKLVHEGGRALAWATLISLLVCALRAPAVAPAQAARGGSQPLRRERLLWFAVTLVCLLLVPTIKQFSSTSCPWDLAEFGGPAQLVSHWRWGTADGGSGRCFPSGHAVGAFAFLSQYFLWRAHRPQRARAWLWAVLVVGCVFGLGQLARGAHHASHSAWSAWLCWAVCVAACAWQTARGSGPVLAA